MDTEDCIVMPEATPKEPILDKWTVPVTVSLKERLDQLPREKRALIHKSTRLFLNRLIEVYSNSDSAESA